MIDWRVFGLLLALLGLSAVSAQKRKPCGGIAGFTCGKDEYCIITKSYPDAMGWCYARSELDDHFARCGGLAGIKCPKPEQTCLLVPGSVVDEPGVCVVMDDDGAKPCAYGGFDKKRDQCAKKWKHKGQTFYGCGAKIEHLPFWGSKKEGSPVTAQDRNATYWCATTKRYGLAGRFKKNWKFCDCYNERNDKPNKKLEPEDERIGKIVCSSAKDCPMGFYCRWTNGNWLEGTCSSDLCPVEEGCSVWVDSCGNTCKCTEEGHPICTKKPCLYGSENTPYCKERFTPCGGLAGIPCPDGFKCKENPITNPADLPGWCVADKTPKVCDNCLAWYDGCNVCECNDDGTFGACTERFCTLEVKEQYCIKPKPPKLCENCAVWFDGCNICECKADGSLGACTKKFCTLEVKEAYCLKPKKDNPPKGYCMDAEDCNEGQWCNIPSGKDYGKCTNKICPKWCETWYDGCNTCFCSGDGIGGCTKRACLVMEEPKCLKKRDVEECQDENDRLRRLLNL